jgi:C4-dicarboxylate-specific signal transduction histidine kinase
LSTTLAHLSATPAVAHDSTREWSPCEVAQSIAHEIKQPLAAILLQAGAARRWLERPEPDLARALEALEQIANAARRADEIVQSLQGLVQRRPVNAQAVHVDATLRQTLALFDGALRRHGITVRLEAGLQDCEVHADRAQIGQVAGNLVANAIDALAGMSGRPRELCLSTRRLGAAMIEICVADNGPGVPAHHRADMFAPRFSTKKQGTGLGLSICLAIAAAHGGHLDHQPNLPHGAVFRFVLPLGRDC